MVVEYEDGFNHGCNFIYLNQSCLFYFSHLLVLFFFFSFLPAVKFTSISLPTQEVRKHTNLFKKEPKTPFINQLVMDNDFFMFSM